MANARCNRIYLRSIWSILSIYLHDSLALCLAVWSLIYLIYQFSRPSYPLLINLIFDLVNLLIHTALLSSTYLSDLWSVQSINLHGPLALCLSIRSLICLTYWIYLIYHQFSWLSRPLHYLKLHGVYPLRCHNPNGHRPVNALLKLTNWPSRQTKLYLSSSLST